MDIRTTVDALVSDALDASERDPDARFDDDDPSLTELRDATRATPRSPLTADDAAVVIERGLALLGSTCPAERRIAARMLDSTQVQELRVVDAIRVALRDELDPDVA